jgi:hypothetical protein
MTGEELRDRFIDQRFKRLGTGRMAADHFAFAGLHDPGKLLLPAAGGARGQRRNSQ